MGQEILSRGNMIILFVLATRFYYCVVVFADEINTDLGWFWMKEWFLISCQVFYKSTGIGEHFELLNWQMEIKKMIE